MANRLTPKEREDLAIVLVAIRAAGLALDADREIARLIAERAHAYLPDIDEVDIGRVLFFAAGAARELTAAGRDSRAIGSVFTLAAADLTAFD